MKSKLITCALLLAGFAVMAQNNEKKQATVRIKKVENINGVEKITDTTYTTDDPDMIISGYDQSKIVTEDISNVNGKLSKTIVIDDHDGKGEPTIRIKTGDPKKDAEIEKELKEAHKNGQSMKKIMIIEDGDKEGKSDIKIMEGDQLNEAELEKLLKEAGIDPKDCKGKKMEKVMIVNEDEHSSKDGKKEKTITKVVMLKMDISNASDEDVKRLKNQFGSVDNKVEMENMKLYPNPNDGKFNLNFNLKNRGDAAVTVYNVEGKEVYFEKLPNFQGEYNKPIDISSNAKGIYFVKIQQGNHTQVKKISLD